MDDFIAQQRKRRRPSPSVVPPLPLSWQRGAVDEVLGPQHVRFRACPVSAPPPDPPALLRCTLLSTRPPPTLSAVCVDLETTGLSTARDAVVSIGAVELRWDGAAWGLGDGSFASLVRPPGRVGGRAARIHRLPPDALRRAEPIEAVAPRLAAFLDGIRRGHSPHAGGVPCVGASANGLAPPEGRTMTLPPLIAHNAAFDAAFLSRQLADAGWRLVWDRVAALTCTRSIFHALHPAEAAGLSEACQIYGIDTVGREERHDALHDAQLCAELFIHLTKTWSRVNERAARMESHNAEHIP